MKIMLFFAVMLSAIYVLVDYNMVRIWASFQYKDHLTKYVDYCYKDKTVMTPSYLYNYNLHTGMTSSTYWGKPL